MELKETTLSGETLYEGKIVRLLKDKVALPNGKTSIREVVDHPGGVGIVPIDRDGNVYLVRQYRYAVGSTMLEIPAGKLERGEEPFLCAKRELGEETGFTAGEYVYLGKFYPTPGYCRELLHIYLALDLTSGETHPDEDEFLNVEKYAFKDALSLAVSGAIPDAKTLIGLLMAEKVLAERENA